MRTSAAATTAATMLLAFLSAAYWVLPPAVGTRLRLETRLLGNESTELSCDYGNLTHPDSVLWLAQTQLGHWVTLYLADRGNRSVRVEAVQAMGGEFNSTLNVPLDLMGPDTPLHVCCGVTRGNASGNACTDTLTGPCHQRGYPLELEVHTHLRLGLPITWLHDVEPVVTVHVGGNVTWHMPIFRYFLRPRGYTLYIFRYDHQTEGQYTAVVKADPHPLFQIFEPQLCDVLIEERHRPPQAVPGGGVGPRGDYPVHAHLQTTLIGIGLLTVGLVVCGLCLLFAFRRDLARLRRCRSQNDFRPIVRHASED